MKVTDKMIRAYCKRMNYELEDIGKIAFSYKRADGSRHALLKAVVSPKNIHTSKHTIKIQCEVV